LAKYLGHDDALVHSRARKALERIAEDQGIDPLPPFLGHPVRAVRAEIAEMSGKIGDPRAVPALVPLLAETGRIHDRTGRATRYSISETLSSLTAGALARIGDPSAKDELIDVLADGEFSGRREPLVEALVAVGGSDVAGALLALLRDGDAATPALGRLSGPAARQMLIDALDGGNDSRARHPVLQAMVKVSGSGTVDALAELARSGGEKERRAAIRALDLNHFVEMGDAEADAALRDVLDPDGVPRWVLYAGATLDDFVIWIEIDGDPMGLGITAAGLRRLCLAALLQQAR
jgi:HEAT repeat protein